MIAATKKKNLRDFSSVSLSDHLEVHMFFKFKTECERHGVTLLFYKCKLQFLHALWKLNSVFKSEIHYFPLLIIYLKTKRKPRK